MDSDLRSQTQDGGEDLGADGSPTRDSEPAPLFRNAGGRAAAAEAITQMEAIMDDFLSFETAAGA